MTLFFPCTPTHSFLISGLPAANTSWKRSIGGSLAAGVGPEPWRHVSPVDRQPVAAASTTADGGWLEWWWGNLALETHICTGYTHVLNTTKHVLKVSVCAKRRVGQIMEALKADSDYLNWMFMIFVTIFCIFENCLVLGCIKGEFHQFMSSVALEELCWENNPDAAVMSSRLPHLGPDDCKLMTESLVVQKFDWSEHLAGLLRCYPVQA